MHFPRNRTRWDKYMLQDISNYNFYGRSELVRLRGKYTVQTAHCAVVYQEDEEEFHCGQACLDSGRCVCSLCRSEKFFFSITLMICATGAAQNGWRDALDALQQLH